jgi:hypothetical protein
MIKLYSIKLLIFVANISIGNVVDCVISGINQAKKDYNKLTKNFQTLGGGPEYFISVSIAKSLKEGLNESLIFLEETWKDSEDAPTGKKITKWHPNYRYDIVVRDSKLLPFAAIEVKNSVCSVSKEVMKDFGRISTAVEMEGDEKIFKGGLFVFYTQKHCKMEALENTKEIIQKRYEALENALKVQKGRSDLNKKLIDPTLYLGMDRNPVRGLNNKVVVWGGGCFILTPRKH